MTIWLQSYVGLTVARKRSHQQNPGPNIRTQAAAALGLNSRLLSWTHSAHLVVIGTVVGMGSRRPAHPCWGAVVAASLAFTAALFRPVGS